MAQNWKVAWVIGASSGIGSHLAQDLAQRGIKTVISARSSSKLEALAGSSDMLYPMPLDVSSKADIDICQQQIETDIGSIDLVIYCAAVWQHDENVLFDAETFVEPISINYLGAVRVTSSVLPQMVARGDGQIALVSSVAGYRGLPNGAAYGASKAALTHFAESIYPKLKKHHVSLNIIHPGFVETPMTATNNFPMPFIMTAEKASALILKGLKKDRFEIAFPWQMAWILKIARILPYRLYFRIIRRYVLK